MSGQGLRQKSKVIRILRLLLCLDFLLNDIDI
nr:MAG TPA: hypothetical protein [Caudoviricetes sp.]